MIDFILEHSLWFLLLIGTGFTLYWLMRHREMLRVSLGSALLLGILHTLVGVLCVKVFAVMETLDFSQVGSMSLFGAVFFLPVLYWLGAKLFKRKASLVFDVFTPCMVFTLLCARVNCLLSGCCLGALIPGTEGWRYPTRELEILFYIVLLIYFWRQDKKLEVQGALYPFYMMVYGAFRFLVEFFRNAQTDSLLHISHLWAVIAFLVGVTVYLELRAPKGKTKKK